MTTIPHSATIRTMVNDYLSEIAEQVDDVIDASKSSAEYRNIYKSCLSCDALMENLAGAQVPSLNVVRTTVRLVAILASLQRPELCLPQLRRAIEASTLTIYFTAHPVEWEWAVRNGRAGIERDFSDPIAYCASREPSFYRNYVVSLLANEKSGLCREAMLRLSAMYSECSQIVHAPTEVSGDFAAILNAAPDFDMDALAKKIRGCLADISLILAGVYVAEFNGLPPAVRSWFDWLVGKSVSRSIRSGPFGLD